jgi:hypothetical protein
VPHRDVLSAVPSGEVEAEAHDPPRAGDRDGLHGDAGVRGNRVPDQALQLLPQPGGGRGASFELDALVQVLGVLPDDHEVHTGVASGHAGVVAGRAHRGEQIELLAEGHIDAPETRAHRCGDGALQRGPALTDGFQDAIGQGGAFPLDDVGARFLEHPVDVGAGGLDHTPGRDGDLRTDAVSWDQRDAVGHAARLAAP